MSLVFLMFVILLCFFFYVLFVFLVGISLFVDRFSEVAQINAVDPDLAGAGITKYYIKQTMFTRDDVSQDEFDL